MCDHHRGSTQLTPQGKHPRVATKARRYKKQVAALLVNPDGSRGVHNPTVRARDAPASPNNLPIEQSEFPRLSP